jgi:hypothetical protein
MRALLGALAIMACSNIALGEGPKRHAVELGVTGIVERATPPNGTFPGVISTRQGGGALAVSLAYRSPYLLTPFVDVAYYPLYERARVVDLGSLGGRATASGSLVAVGFMGGLALDLFRIRVRVGVGTYDVITHSNVAASSIGAAESDFGYLFALDGTVLQTARFRLGLETRAAFVVEANVVALGMGLTMSGDLIRF